MRRGRAEQYAVRYDAGTAPTDAQHTQKECQKQQLGFLGFADLQQVRRNGICIQTALERRIGKDERILLLVRILITEAVPVFDKRIVNTVSHHVHGTDTQHGAIHIVAEEHMVHVVVFLLSVEEDFFLAMFFQIFTRRNKETGGAASRVADHIISFRIHQFHHHANDMTRGTELTVPAGLADLAEQILICIAAYIHCLRFVH